jgi:tetratricopeptide (TPR) repeat protein
MTPLTCSALRERWDDYRISNLPVDEGRAIERHLEECAACRELTALLGAVEAAVEAVEMDPLTRRRIAVAVAAPRTAPRAAVSRPRLALGFGALAAACAVCAAIAVWRADRNAGAPPKAAAKSSVAAAVAAIAPSAPRPEPVRIAAEERRYVELFEGTGLAVAPGSEVTQLRADAREGRFVLRRGRVVAVIGPHEPGFRFVVATPSGAEIEARGTVFAVEVSADGAERARVLRGVVEVRAAGQHGTSLAAGQEIALGEPLAGAAAPEAIAADRALVFGEAGPAPEQARPGRSDVERREALARQARDYRRARRFEEAADAYARLIAQYPGSESATNGLVALGEIELDVLGAYDRAARHFERYLGLAPGGYLAEAAAAGRVRALSRAGQGAQAARCAGTYLGAYPDGPNAAEMRRIGAAGGR